VEFMKTIIFSNYLKLHMELIHTGENGPKSGPIVYLFQRVTQIENEMLIKDIKINKIESELLLSDCRVKKLEEDIKLLKNEHKDETLDMKTNTDKQSLLSLIIKKENFNLENEEEYGEKVAKFMKIEGGIFSMPIKQEKVELENVSMEGSESENGDAQVNRDQRIKVEKHNIRDDCTVRIKKEIEEGVMEERHPEENKLAAEEVNEEVKKLFRDSEHLKENSEGKPYKCIQCNQCKSYTHHWMLNKHVQRRHQLNKNQPNKEHKKKKQTKNREIKNGEEEQKLASRIGKRKESGLFENSGERKCKLMKTEGNEKMRVREKGGKVELNMKEESPEEGELKLDQDSGGASEGSSQEKSPVQLLSISSCLPSDPEIQDNQPSVLQPSALMEEKQKPAPLEPRKPRPYSEWEVATSEFNCTLCKVTCATENNFSEHLAGRKHRRTGEGPGRDVKDSLKEKKKNKKQPLQAQQYGEECAELVMKIKSLGRRTWG